MASSGVGLVGYGLAGSVFHAPLISAAAGLYLKKIVSSQRSQITAAYPMVEVAATVEELLDDPAIELVVVASPNPTHLPIARQALQAGKHVVVDKPFTNTVAEADELIHLARQQNRLLSVFQSRRWDNDFLTLQACLKSGTLGELYSYEAHYDRFRLEVRDRWREQDQPGSGMLYDLGAHLIDQALYLFGPPQTVWADLQKQRPGSPVVDYFHLLLNYESLRVILHSGSVVRQPGPHFQIHGSKGSFVKYGMDSQEDALKAGKRPGDAVWGADDPANFAQLTTDLEGVGLVGRLETLPGAYETYYTMLAKAIQEGQPLPVNAEEARLTIKIIEMAIESSATRREVRFEV